MRPRHPALPTCWLLTDERQGEALWPALRRLPLGSGVIVRHHSLERAERGRFLRRVRRVAATRKLLVLDDKRARIARVHSAAELRSALLARAELVFLSPIYPTCTHPDWRPLHRLRAAAILQLTRQPVLALGGMDARRFGRVRALGFAGFGAIDAWLEARRLRT